MSLLDHIEGAHRPLLRVSGGCSVCPRKRLDFVPATLVKGKVLWLGEAPGAEEVVQGEGFVGRSGQLLRRIASECGVPGPWSFSNTIHCRPPENAPPKPREVECCLSQFVLDEIRGYPIVVLCGSVPLSALFPGAQASHFRGNVAWHPDFPGQRFYTLYHPAYILRFPGLEDEFRRQMQRLAKIVLDQDAKPPWNIVRGDAAMQALPGILSAPLISPDIETDRVESWEAGAKIKSLCVTADGITVAAFTAEDFGFPAALAQLRDYLEKPEKSVVGSNVAFDLQWLEQDLEFKVRVTGIYDTNVIWYEAGQYKHPNLKQLVSEQLDGYRYLIHAPHLEKDVERLLLYNAEDVVYPLQLFKKGLQRMEPQTRDLVTRVQGPVTLIYRQMQARGMYLRQDYRKLKIAEYAEKRKAAVQAWKDADPDFIPKEYESGNGLSRYLFGVKKLPVISLTDSEEASTDKAAIKQWIRDGHTYLEHLLTIKSIDKLMSTYLVAYDKHVTKESRIHPSFWLTSTDTSRPSSSNPNLFNIPRNNEIRDLFGVPRGSVLLESDLSQIEFRIMVCRAKDENGIAGYLRGDDAHTMTARTIAGVEHPTKAQRSEAKPVNFALLYGGDWPVVQRQALNEFGMDWSEETCRKFTRFFFQTYPGIQVFHEDCRTRLVYNRGWFQSITGHSWHYRDWDSSDKGARDHVFRAAINSEGQGPAVNLCYYIAVLSRRLLDERGFKTVHFLNSVYDSIMTEIPNPKWAPDVAAIINEATQMAHEWVKEWFVVPLIIKHALGESWGSLEEFKI